MELRTAFTITLASLGAALLVPACELLKSEPLVCSPKPAETDGPVPQADAECTACIEQQCGNVGENCVGECDAYGDCACACDENDLACFDSCADDKTEECTSCEQSHSNAVLACVMDKCLVCAGAGGSASASAGDDNADGDGEDDTGGDDSWTDTGGDDSWTDTGGDDSWTDSGSADDASSFTDDGDTGGGAACDELHSQCCPNLEGFDLELCETTVDERSCQFWLDVFQEEGSC